MRQRIFWWRPLSIGLAGLVLAGGGFAAGTTAEHIRTATSVAAAQPARPTFDLLWEAVGLVREHYVDQQALDDTRMSYGAIKGLVDALGDDGHSRFLTPKELESQKNVFAGRLVGIGVNLAIREGRPIVESPIVGSPAEQAGLLSGDVIVQIDGRSTADLSLNQVIELIRGPAGSPVTLSILRPGTTTPADFTLVRATIRLPSVSWAIVPGTSIAHLLVSQFTEHTTDELVKALGEIRAYRANALVLDLRNNGGGLLSGAIEAATQFVIEGNVLLEVDAKGERKPVPVRPGGGIALDLPMVVLINSGTTSAGEILAGAIQGNRRGPLVGAKTFGTGTVLYTYMLSDGSALMLGAVEWLTPDGRKIWRQGIQPDVRVNLPSEVQPVTPKKIATLSPDELRDSKDAQFLRALQELTSAAAAAATQ